MEYYIILMSASGGLLVVVFVLLLESLRKFFSKRGLTEETEGTIIGMCRNSWLQSFNTYSGNVPENAKQTLWAEEPQTFWGAVKFRILPYFPCVCYEVAGNEFISFTGAGTSKGRWKIGSNVRILYNKEKPGQFMICGDESYKKMCIIYLVVFLVALEVFLILIFDFSRIIYFFG